MSLSNSMAGGPALRFRKQVMACDSGRGRGIRGDVAGVFSPVSSRRSAQTVVRSRMVGSLVCAAALLAGVPSVRAIDFQSEIVPIFAKHCAECHGADMAKPKGGFIFDTPEALAKHINMDASKGFFVPGKPGESDMMRVLTLPLSADEVMPPSGKERIPQTQLDLIRDWIKAGAPLTKEEELVFREEQEKKMNDVRTKFWEWTNLEGKTIKARFIRRDGSKVVFQTEENGPEIEYPMSKLSQDSKLLAFRLSQMMLE
jgi:hypothetical protein